MYKIPNKALLKDKALLSRLYVEQYKSAEDIGQFIGCSKYSVLRALKAFEVPLRKRTTKNPLLNDREQIRKYYVDDNLSLPQIATLTKSTVGNIWTILQTLGIKTRNYKEGIRARFPDGKIGITHPNWQGGRRKCLNCDKLVVKYNAIRCKSCEGENRKQEKNVNWKGGITPLNKLIRNSKEYKNWKKSVLERDNYSCQVCGSTKYVEADHVKQFAYFPEFRFDVNNGKTLCQDCHKIKTQQDWQHFQEISPIDKS